MAKFARLAIFCVAFVVSSTSCDVTSGTGTCDCSEAIKRLQKSLDNLNDILSQSTVVITRNQAATSCPNEIKTYQKAHYKVIEEDGARWRLFWWYKANTTWPALVSDVLQDKYGDCDASAPYCFGRLPEALMENQAEMLGIDSADNAYRWKFNSNNRVSHAVWEAFHDHKDAQVKNVDVWNPKVIRGTAPKAAQDSFHYRMEHGVRSLQIDDDNCDCLTSLSMGHGMCLEGFSTQYGPENVYGVDLLYDTYCNTPKPSNGLFLYFRDDDDCMNVTCPANKVCVDGIYSYVCVDA
ncbi:uncharacterized protein LOC106163256 [Lingula anatina]|uniref:Uncharacterized protein LOC106163256 n=1 Tax=Lingula anatina TaxID=7574 RepID=A0A1S3IDL9_LINAN|nr:uncharacterized protein LOC106163256 [Lingula anatina]|eukprot:XP_013396253.1 uncharacterized protein LOC106163256 [Lingula anatina]